MSDETVIEDTHTDETEARARRLGWVPKEDFKGDPDKWRPADEFLSRGEQLMPMLRRDNERLHERLSKFERLIADKDEAIKDVLEYTRKSEERSYQRAKAEIEERIAQAAANADPATVRAEMAKLDQLEKPAPKVEERKTEPAIDPEIQDWLGKNDWYNKDRALNGYATDVWSQLEREAPGMSTADKLAETKKRTMDKFPEKFGINPKREGAAAVATPSGETRQRKTGKTYDDLPADAKKACDRFVKMIPGYTREDYVKNYEWDN